MTKLGRFSQMGLYNPIKNKFLTDSDLVEATKGIRDGLKDTIPALVDSRVKSSESAMAMLVGNIVHKEMESKAAQLEKEYASKFLAMKESVEYRLKSLQEDYDTQMKELLVVAQDQVNRLEKHYEDRVEFIKEFYEKSYAKAMEDMKDFMQTIQVKNVVQVPEGSIQVNLPEMAPTFQVPVPEVKNLFQPNIPLKDLRVHVEHKSILEESDKVSEKSIKYSETTGRPTSIRETIKRIKS